MICPPTQTFASDHVTLQSFLFILELSLLKNMEAFYFFPKMHYYIK